MRSCAFGEGHEGLLPVRRLRGDWWDLNEEGTILHGSRSGERIRLGDPIDVRVERIEAPRGRVDLLPVDGAAGQQWHDESRRISRLSMHGCLIARRVSS